VRGTIPVPFFTLTLTLSRQGRGKLWWQPPEGEGIYGDSLQRERAITAEAFKEGWGGFKRGLIIRSVVPLCRE
jgi:hypothetical protein